MTQRSVNSPSGELPRRSPGWTSTRTAEAYREAGERSPPGCGGTDGETALAKACNRAARNRCRSRAHVCALHKGAVERVSDPGVNDAGDVRQPVRDGVRFTLGVTDLGGRDRA